ncbi:MAG: PTS fructose transporter subunit IIA [Gammaproteobacteria bacterium]|jgi:PTS system ascorbate-specific IIA component
MKTGLLLITHGSLGSDLLETAIAILNACPIRTETIAVAPDCDPDEIFASANRLCRDLDEGYGVLVLTDLFGSTPSNIAVRLAEAHNVYVISGANIPMLLRVLNYSSLCLAELAEKAASGARDGVIITPSKKAG